MNSQILMPIYIEVHIHTSEYKFDLDIHVYHIVFECIYYFHVTIHTSINVILHSDLHGLRPYMWQSTTFPYEDTSEQYPWMFRVIQNSWRTYGQSTLPRFGWEFGLKIVESDVFQLLLPEIFFSMDAATLAFRAPRK